MRRLLIYIVAGLLFVTAGCDWDGRQKQEEAEKVEAALQAAVDEARDVGESLSADQEKFFRPEADQAIFLEAFTATSASDTVNGYFTNQDGVSGYFQGYDRPFNFLWIGGTVEMTAFDGRTYRVIDGPGELLLKYHDDALLLQRSKGEFKAGLWHGYGELWTRNRDAGGHNYRYYRGEFVNDHMSGRGVLINYNFMGRGDHPGKYEGDLRDNLYHGQGLLTDLATGEMTYKGLWLEGRRFVGSPEDWQVGDEWSELNSVEHQYRNVFMTDDLTLAGDVNSKPGEGALTLIVPKAFENAALVDRAGHSYSIGALLDSGERDSGFAGMFNGAVLEVPLSDYPLTLTLSYELENKRHHFQVTAKRPFELIVGANRLNEAPESNAPVNVILETDELEQQIKDLLVEPEGK